MDSKQASQVTTGLVVVAIGLMMLAGQFDSTWAWDFGRMWPIVFVVLGVGRLMTRDGRGSGLWFLALGAIFFMHTYGVLRLSRSWPLFIVLGGISMMFPKAGCADKKVRT
ncbi:MAG TPA: DUF5668 domain-containing protein [Vicinamibacterales bacterium]|nr:DUF5668 domain-containing protein [Vicinamibacterales bacterium]